MMRVAVSAISALLVMFIASGAVAEPFPRPEIDDAAQIYQCQRAVEPVAIDGALDDQAWQNADWTADFADIQGLHMAKPTFRTRAKILWDDEYLYIGAELTEPHLQASFTEHDSFIYQLDNDFEVFIDPNCDTHYYFELEINALNTVWDLVLTRPYRDNGMALHGWDFKGLKTAVHLDGTLNDPADVDKGWSVEIAIPWSALTEAAGTSCPPQAGDYWRMNFSRVEWPFTIENGQYVQVPDPVTGEHYAEDNWVWNPPGLIAMHYPERWGFVVFWDEQPSLGITDTINELDAVSQVLFDVYYLQRDYYEEHGEYALFIAVLRWNEQRYATAELRPLFLGDGQHYQAMVELPEGGLLWLDDTGRTWRETAKGAGDGSR